MKNKDIKFRLDAADVHTVIAFDDGSLTVDFATKPKKKTLLALQRKAGMVFQSYNLFPHKTALENLMLGPTVVQGQSKAQAREQALALLEKVGLSDKADLYPYLVVSSSELVLRVRWLLNRRYCCSMSQPRRLIQSWCRMSLEP